MNEITILHISDLHYDKNNEKIKDSIKTFFDDLDKSNKKIDLIIFSGDLVQKGDSELFKEAKEKFIDPLLKKLNLTINDFFIVPGNHETNRNNISPYELIIKKNCSEEDICKIFNEKDDKIFIKKLQEFNDFKKDLNQKSVELNDIFSTHQKIINNKSFGISCLNSSLFCRKNDKEVDEGNLILSKYQVTRATESIKNSEFKICVFHHGLDCLKMNDKLEIEKLLYKNYDLLLTGHFHDETIKDSYMNGQHLVKSIVGSLCDMSNMSNKYSFITIYDDKIKINFRCYYHERGEYDIDLKLFPKGEYIIERKNNNKLIRTEINYNMIEWTENKASKKLLSSSTSCNAPKKIEEIFVEPIFSLKTQDELLLEKSKDIERKEKNEKTIYLKDILDKNENYIFIGEKESGKTTLINHMMLKILKNNIDDKIIPVYFKGKEFCLKKNFINEIMKYLIDAGAKDISYKETEELAKEGRFVFFIDDFYIKDDKNLKNVEDKIKIFNKNRFLIFIKSNYNSINLDIKENIEKLNFDKTILYTKSFNKKQIKELTLKWKKQSDIENKKIEQLVKNINKMGISKTPHILSLMLLVTETKTNFLPENKALLLDVFFDILLEKMNINSMFSSVNYNVKINYLSYIAKCMKDKKVKEFLRTELENETTKYSSELNLPIYKISDFVDQFIERGVFYEENNKISFKYQSFYEFFIAKQMTESKEFRELIFNKDTYFYTPEEIEYYSGLKNENPYSLSMIFSYIKSNIKINKENIENYEFNVNALEYSTENIIEKVETTQSNNDDFIQEDPEYEIKPRYSKDCQDQNRTFMSNLEKYIITLKLLSNIFRNSYLVKEKKLREDVFNELILNYSALLIKIDQIFKDRFLKKKKIQDFLRIIFCSLFSEFLIDNLASEKIILFLRDKMNLKNNKIENFILNILYLNCFYEDSLEKIFKYIDEENNFLFLEVIQLNLLKYYYLKKCSEKEVQILKEALRKIYLKKTPDNKNYIDFIKKKKIESKISEKVDSILDFTEYLE